MYPSQDTYKTLDEAKEKCFYDERCEAIYDRNCYGSDYRFCYVGNEITSAVDDCLYRKAGNHVFIDGYF